jgi:hypothetical protein
MRFLVSKLFFFFTRPSYPQLQVLSLNKTTANGHISSKLILI